MKTGFVVVCLVGAILASCRRATDGPASSKNPATSLAPFRFADQPILDLGRTATTPVSEFAFPEALHRMPDGRVVIGEYLARQIRVVDSTGKVLKTVARWGHGPGEIPTQTHMIAVPLMGDTIGILVEDACCLNLLKLGRSHVR